jgi:RNA polymerase sigma factor (sigma-70 family)
MAEGLEMSSTCGIRFGANVRILEGGSMQMDDSSAATAYIPDTPIAHRSGEMEDRELWYDTACEIQLVSAAKSGDDRAFAELCRRHTPSMKRWIQRILRNPEDSDDILQDTLFSAYKHLRNFHGKCSFRTWILTIATNNTLMLVRKRKNHPETGLTYVTADGDEFEILGVNDPLPNPEEVYARRQANHRVAQAVRRLPASFRQIVERFHQDEARLVDAANAVGITVAAAKSRLMRARQVLRRHLKNENTRNRAR